MLMLNILGNQHELLSDDYSDIFCLLIIFLLSSKPEAICHLYLMCTGESLYNIDIFFEILIFYDASVLADHIHMAAILLLWVETGWKGIIANIG